MVPAGEGSSLNSIKKKGTVVTKSLGNNNNYFYRKREKSVFSLLMLPYIREKKVLQFIATFSEYIELCW